MANEIPYAYKNVTAAETVTLRGGSNKPAGVLGYVNINTVGTGTLIIYDGPDNTFPVVATITVTAAGAIYEYNAQMNTGLTYVRSVADGNITISYR